MDSIARLIDQWNASRLELFKISKPDKNKRFQGVMRFFYESNDKYHSKCIRVFSDMNVKHLLPLLWEKFSILTRRVRLRDIRLYERCGNLDNMLGPEERPLLIQLCWCQDDKEGIFVLRSIADDCVPRKDTMCTNSCIDSNGNPCISKYCDDEPNMSSPILPRLQNSYLSRTISNPESLMKLRRKSKLEAKLLQIFRSGDINGGGTLKIYGDSINAMIPYKSLLLSIDDTAAYVVREFLDKYGLDKEDPNDYCLVKVTCKDSSDSSVTLTNGNEEVLQKNDSPLRALLTAVQDPCNIKFKVIRCPPHLRKRSKPKSDREKDRHPPERDIDRLSAPQTKSRSRNSPGVSRDSGRQIGHADSGIESQQSYSHSGLYPSTDQMPIYDSVNNNVYSTPPFSISHVPISRPLPSYEESIHRTRLIKGIAVSRQIASPFGDSGDSFSFSSDCMEDLSYNTESLNGSMNNMDEQMPHAIPRDHDLSSVSDLDTQLSRHLPVQITYFKSKEDLLLDSLILDVKPSQIKFKLSLAYVLHLMVVDIIRLTCINKTSRTDLELIMGNFVEKVTSKIRQSIMKNRCHISVQTFWLANCTEFLYLLKNNPLLFRLNVDHFQRFYELFADNTQCCFQYISYCFKDDVLNTLPVLLAEYSDDAEDQDNQPLSKKVSKAKVMSDLVRTLSSCMSVLHQCHVNPALVIQIMSRVFHFINCWTVNKFIDNKVLLCHHWGLVVGNRLERIRRWSADNDLLLAADCYLQKSMQMCRLIMIEKTDVEVLYNDGVDLVQINSLQMRHFLENYSYEPDELAVPQIWIDFVASGVTQVADKIFEEEGINVTLRENEDLDLPLLLPDDGYHVDVLFGGIPDGFIEYLDELHREWCFYKISHQNIHFDWLCQKAKNKETVPDPPIVVEQFNIDIPKPDLGNQVTNNGHKRHQLKLSDFKGNISTINSDLEHDRIQRYFKVEPHSQETSSKHELVGQIVSDAKEKQDGFSGVENASTYASSFSTEMVDIEKENKSHNEHLQSIRHVRSSVETNIRNDSLGQGQLVSWVDQLHRTYDTKLREMMSEFEREKNGDMFRMNYRQLRLAECRDEVFQRYRTQKETDSSLQRRRIDEISNMEANKRPYYPMANTFPGYGGSQPPQSFVSTSLALRNTLNYPPKVKPKPRSSSSLTWRSRSQSVASISPHDSGLATLSDMRPRSKSSDRYYSRTFDGQENLSFREKLNLFEYGLLTTSH